MFPVRCFSCGKVISNSWEEYKKRTGAGEESAKVLDNLDISRYCCRRIFLAHVELVDIVAPYQ